MAELVKDWLADYQRARRQPAESEAFVVEHETDPEIAEAIFTIFNERQRNEDLIHDICQQLLAFYRAPEVALHKFPLQFIPVLIYTYLHAVAAGDKKASRGVETLLICIYNGEVSTDDGGQKVVAFRMPILAQASVYHEVKNLPMTDLRRWEENCNREVKWGPHLRIESINAQNRMRILTALLFCYNQQVSLTQKSSLLHLCRVTSQLVNQGFTTKSGHGHRMSYGSDPATGATFPKPSSPRIPLSASFLIELVHAIYYAMFNGYGTIAIQTLEDIHNRASYEMYTELILVTNAVRNSLHANPSGQPNDGPMGLSVALTPATNTVTTSVSKSMITNASFRTKKLPDDIPIQVQDLTMPQAPQQLASVSEETEPGAKESPSTKESSGTRTSIIRPSMEGIKAQAHKALIAGFKKSKDKEKEKDKEPPKPPQRKFDKHTQRNSLLQLQSQTTDDYEKSPLTVSKSKTYDAVGDPQPTDMLPIQTLSLINENGSNSFSIDSDMNDGIAAVLAGQGNNVPAGTMASMNSNTTSITSSDLLTKSFDSSVEMTPMGHSNSNGGKLAEHGLE
ncbi:hyccin [Drosophila sulfurigaster albostrigata]|uniref:hyccin n=1 Tax=Drosophila sulfurigaster albostrigata TaxID=89887 RepID=UPI002D21DD97|nr:hyccin [Drosophila sulfurigaster albostrigata]